MQSKDIINLTQTLGDKFLIQKIILTTVESCTGGYWLHNLQIFLEAQLGLIEDLLHTVINQKLIV